MESKRSLELGLLVSICFIMGLKGMALMPAPSSAGVILKVGTGPVGGHWFPLGAALSTIVNEKVAGLTSSFSVSRRVFTLGLSLLPREAVYLLKDLDLLPS